MSHRTLPFPEARRRATGTAQVGVIEADYDQLVDVFGQPGLYASDKSRREWVVVFEDDIVATIYDFLPEHGHLPVPAVLDWHVGGTSPDALIRVREAMGRTACCGATTTFHDDVHCCKACWEEVPLCVG